MDHWGAVSVENSNSHIFLTSNFFLIVRLLFNWKKFLFFSELDKNKEQKA